MGNEQLAMNKAQKTAGGNNREPSCYFFLAQLIFWLLFTHY
jgi:hypothetical protein